MNIGFDVRMIENSGIGTTIREFLDNLREEQLKKMTLLSSPGWKNPYPSAQKEVPYGVYSLRQHWGYPKILKELNLTLYHMPHFDVPMGYAGPFVSTIHDLIHILFPQYSTKPFSRLYAKCVIGHVVKKAKRIIAVSQNTKRDILRFFPNAEGKIKVIPSGVDPLFKPVEGEPLKKVMDRFGLAPGYFLYVGNLRESKNTPGLLSAYKILRDQDPSAPPLVLAGSNTYKKFQDHGFPEGVRYLGAVDKDCLPGLYSGAKVFVFPSFYEGFGIPPLEAMACGTPVIASNAASLPEVCGDAALMIDPENTSSLARAMEDLNCSEEKRGHLKDKGFVNVKRFSLKSYADAVWDVYMELLEAGL